jgi:hypothetical protein
LELKRLRLIEGMIIMFAFGWFRGVVAFEFELWDGVERGALLCDQDCKVEFCMKL